MFERETAESACQGSRRALLEAERLGLPASGIEVKCDHGSAFTSNVFREFLAERSCGQTLSAVGQPQGMRRVERFNRSVKEQALIWEDLRSSEELQGALDAYRRYDNEVRPHAALACRTPLSLIQSGKTEMVPFS